MTEKYTNEIVLENINRVKSNIDAACKKSGRNPKDVTLLAATKTVSAQTINFALDNGITAIGENRVQELLSKYDEINKDKADIHFIGRLQTNKVKYIIDKVSMIHSVDSLKLAAEIDRQAAKHSLIMNILAEVNIGNEESKGGVGEQETLQFVKELAKFKNIRVCGLMTIPPPVIDTANVNENSKIYCNIDNFIADDKKIYKNQLFFKKIMKLFLDISAKNIDNIYMQHLSMGMSDDYESAVLEGSTIVRVGRGLFGAR